MRFTTPHETRSLFGNWLVKNQLRPSCGFISNQQVGLPLSANLQGIFRKGENPRLYVP
jgi:hypothetical protein